MEFPWMVRIPPQGPLSRTHLWAALKHATSTVTGLLSRAGQGYPRSEDPSLTDDEARAVTCAVYRLGAAADALDPNVLDRMAGVVDDQKSDAAEKANLPEDVHAIVDSYHGDVYAYMSRHSEGENLVLAFATLQAASGLDDEDMSLVFSKVLGRADRHGDIRCRLWTCPVCDAFPVHYKRTTGKPCRRCCGWGYVFGKEPHEEYVAAEKAAALEAAKAEEEEAAKADGSAYS